MNRACSGRVRAVRRRAWDIRRQAWDIRRQACMAPQPAANMETAAHCGRFVFHIGIFQGSRRSISALMIISAAIMRGKPAVVAVRRIACSMSSGVHAASRACPI
jgi:hypothetical protein